LLFSPSFGVFVACPPTSPICTLKLGVSEKETLSPFHEHLVVTCTHIKCESQSWPWLAWDLSSSCGLLSLVWNKPTCQHHVMGMT
jgi:hypothetical protein